MRLGETHQEAARPAELMMRGEGAAIFDRSLPDQPPIAS